MIGAKNLGVLHREFVSSYVSVDKQCLLLVNVGCKSRTIFFILFLKTSTEAILMLHLDYISFYLVGMFPCNFIFV